MITELHQRRCKREDCRNWFPVYPGQRGRPKEFCSEKCRQIRFTGALEEEIRKAQQRARKYQSSLSNCQQKYQSHLGRRQIVTGLTAFFLGLLLEKWPHGKRKTVQHETAWQELGEIRHLLLWGTPDPYVAIASARATALQEVLAPLALKDRTARRIWIYCEEIKRDAGVEGVSEEALKQVEMHVKTVEQLWNDEHDHLNFVHALLSHAILDGIRRDREPDVLVAEGYADQARRRLRAALNILEGPCYKQDRVLVNMLRHRAILMRFRLEAFYYRDENTAKQSLAEMEHCEEQVKEGIASPLLSIETLREKAGYCQAWKHDLDEANTLLTEANTHFQKLSDAPILAQLSLLRPKLEILRQRRDYSSLEEEWKKYLVLLHKHPSAHNVNQLRNLARVLEDENPEKIACDIPTVYTQPLQVYLYNEDFSLRREGIV